MSSFINESENSERVKACHDISAPLAGLPRSASQVDHSPAAHDDLKYRAFVCGGSGTALLKTAASVASVKDRGGIDSLSKQTFEIASYPKLDLPPPPISIRYVDIQRPLGTTHVSLEMTDEEVLCKVDSFLTDRGISCEKRHPHSNMFRCRTVVDCAVVCFDIRLVPTNGVSIEFKRTLGPAELFSKIFKAFRVYSGASQSRSASPVSPCRSLDDDDEPVDEEEIQKAIAAMAQWIVSDPVEAIQCVGQFYMARNTHVVHSSEILHAICGSVRQMQECADEVSMIAMSVAIACLRQHMTAVVVMDAPCKLTQDHISIIAPGIAKAAMCSDATARREAVGFLVDTNPQFSSEIKQRIEKLQGHSFCSATSDSESSKKVFIRVA